MNIGHEVRSAGHTFGTMEEYIAAHESVIGRISNRKKKQDSILRQFGSIEGFVAALDAENHRVERVERLGVCPLYAVVVSSAGSKKGQRDPVWTPPVVIWPVGNEDPFGAGVVINS